jgi:hypothetical protein
MSLIFIYTTLVNIVERPEGIKIASFFIIAMVVSSLISRALRSTELRIQGIQLDDRAVELLEDDEDRVIRVVARRPKIESEEDLDVIDGKLRYYHSLSPDECLCFFEVERGDASDFGENLLVTGERVGKDTGSGRVQKGSWADGGHRATFRIVAALPVDHLGGNEGRPGGHSKADETEKLIKELKKALWK